jgi:beta-glucosidase
MTGNPLCDASQSGFPVIVTENGLADADDRYRADFIESHVAAIERSGVPVHGYLHWSLLDNYEWLDGFGPKFGLYDIERRPRASIAAFRAAGQRFQEISAEFASSLRT